MDSHIADSDWETLSESSSSDDQEDIDFSYGRQARSILSSLEESILKIDDLLSFEQIFFHGNLVSSLSDPSGQMGRIVSVDMFLDLENVQGNVLKNVNSKKLVKIRSISGGDYVVKGPWLGQAQRVVDKVTVLFDDGAKCEILVLEKEKLTPLTHIFLEDSQYPYYPGQRVRIKSSTASKSARWLCGPRRDNQDEGTVSAVEPGLVNVKWFASVLFGSNFNADAPPCWQDSKNLTLLSCFSHASWTLGDWCMFPVAEQEEHMIKHASACDFSAEHSVARRRKRNNLNPNIKELFIIVKIKSKIDILWQNGELTTGQDPQNLTPVNAINTHDFWPQQYVLEKGASDDPLQPSSQRWGVVLSVDAKERTVMVNWKTVHISEPDNSAKDTMVETVSAYELVEHPDYSFFFGDIVFKAQGQLDSQAEENNAKSVSCFNVEAPLRDRDEISYENKASDDYYLSSIGNVVGFRDGYVEVKWASGLITKVAPYEIFRIDKPERSAEVPFSFELNFEESSHEMLEHGSLPSDQKGKGLLSCEDGIGNHEKDPGECSSFSLSQAAFEFFSSIKATILKTLGVASDSGAVPPVPTIEEGKETDFPDKKDLEARDPCTESHTVNESQPAEDQTPCEEFKIHERNDFPVSLDSKSSGQLKQFDIIDNCSDHHFFDEGKGLALSQVKRDWVKKVQQEWSILEKNLPETIYVRVFEERMDLMRAAIVGASGTPYHDGLFFFDICFPPHYPSEPPMVHYNSGGLRLNPNLYESGKVCLSLLNTWTGSSSEVWNPRASTVLQVLLSLQALVLNERPYFNEAGYDLQIGRAEGEKNSVSYNENAYLVTCKSMLYLLRKPPQHFEALVEEHFRQRSQHILSACKAYLEGAPIGYAFESGKAEDGNQKGTSTGFKIMLGKLLPMLAEAFSDKGVDCSQFIELQK